MAEFFHSDLLAWNPVRPDLTEGVTGLVLVDDAIKAVLTRVATGGRFASHTDSYGHLFLIISGSGRIRAGAVERTLGPGDIVRIPAGEPHGYQNTGEEALVLMSFNLPTAP